MPSDKVITSVAATVSFALAFGFLLIGIPGRILLIPLFICAALWMIILLGANAAAQNTMTAHVLMNAFGPLLGTTTATVLYFLLNSGD